MPPIQDRQDTFERLVEKLVEEKLAPPRLDHGAVVCGVLGLVVLVTMLLISTGTIPLYDWRPSGD